MAKGMSSSPYAVVIRQCRQIGNPAFAGGHSRKPGNTTICLLRRDEAGRIGKLSGSHNDCLLEQERYSMSRLSVGGRQDEEGVGRRRPVKMNS